VSRTGRGGCRGLRGEPSALQARFLGMGSYMYEVNQSMLELEELFERPSMPLHKVAS
jgi:hypothetical protein